MLAHEHTLSTMCYLQVPFPLKHEPRHIYFFLGSFLRPYKYYQPTLHQENSLQKLKSKGISNWPNQPKYIWNPIQPKYPKPHSTQILMKSQNPLIKQRIKNDQNPLIKQRKNRRSETTTVVAVASNERSKRIEQEL